jgi:hypothetical protein
MSERTLDTAHLAAIRAARDAVLDAARRDDAPAIDAALARFVRAMWDADFTRQTIRSLVGAAIDAALPTGRGPARRARRAEALAGCVARAEELTERLAEDAPPRTF